jgi:hypothetical protein
MFESVAGSYGPRAIACVLTGTGSDGVMGASAIKVPEMAVDQRGGEVMADTSDPGFVAEDETRLTRLACPGCGGVLAEIALPSISYFRCHVGHQFGPQALAAAQADASEAKLWGALAAMEEQAVVLRHLAEHQPAGASGEGGDSGEQRADYARRAGEVSDLADTIRAHLRRDQDTR